MSGSPCLLFQRHSISADTSSLCPCFETDEERSYFLIRLPVHEGFQEIEQESGLQTPEVTPEVKRLLGVLDRDMSRVELMAVLRLSDEKHFRGRYLQKAIREGYIEMTIPNSPRSKNQKYRLTSL